jgi:hypothetical protein
MKYLNSLFPPYNFDGDFGASGIPPYTPALRNGIRLAVFRHVMSEHPFSTVMQQRIRNIVLQWIDFQDYPSCRQNLSSYIEGARKLEEACFQVISAHEKRKKAVSVAFYATQSTAQTPAALQNLEASASELLAGRPAQSLEDMINRQALSGGTVATKAQTTAELDEHPLAGQMNMSREEKASLSLLLPKSHSSEGT